MELLIFKQLSFGWITIVVNASCLLHFARLNEAVSFVYYQGERVSSSAHNRLSVTPLGGAVSRATGLVRPATALVQQTATFVLMETPLFTDSAPWWTVHWDNIMMVWGEKKSHFYVLTDPAQFKE